MKNILKQISTRHALVSWLFAVETAGWLVLAGLQFDGALAQQLTPGDDPVVARYQEVLVQAGKAACQADPTNTALCQCLNDELIAMSTDPQFVSMLKGQAFDAEQLAQRIARVQMGCMDKVGK